MSSITNRIATVFTASSGNVRAVMGEVAGGMGNIGRSINQTTRNSTALSNQLRALATTARYALAGSAVFGAMGLVRNLSQLQTEAALLTSINPKIENLGGGFTKFFDTLQQGSMDSLTPVNELANAAVNLVSSLQVDPSSIAGITTTLAQGAQLAQAPVEDLTKGITGMIQAFGEAPTEQNIEGLTRGFITVTRRAPGGIAAGPQIIQQLGPSALAARLANISPQQLFGLITTVLRAGGSPATGMRGLNFLLQSIATPNKAEAKVLAGIGITPEFVQQQGGLAAIQKLVQAMKVRGVTGNIGRNAPAFLMGDEQLDTLDSMGMQGMKGLGVGGQGLLLAQRAVGRIHGVRALIALLQQMNTGMFSQDIQEANKAITGVGNNGRAVNDQFKKFASQQPLRAAAMALNNIAMEAPRALENVLDPLARPIAHLGQFTMQHQKGTRKVLEGTAAFMAALGLANITGITGLAKGGLGRLLGRFTPGNMFVRERAIQAAVNPERAGVLGGSPQNPMYVTVVGQLFGGGPQGPGGGLISDAEKAATGGGLFAIARRLLGTKLLGRLAIGAGAAGAGLFATSRDQAKVTPGMVRELEKRYRAEDPRRLLLQQYGLHHLSRQGFNMQFKTAESQAARLRELNQILRPFHRRDPLYGVTAIYSQQERMIHGKAVVELNVALSTKEGVKRKKIQIPMNLYSHGRNPSMRGQGGKTKANVP